MEVVIIGVFSDCWGEMGKVVIVVKFGEILGEDEVIFYCLVNLVKFKVF